MKSLMTLVILGLFSSASAAGLKFKDCSLPQLNDLIEMNEESILEANLLLSTIKQRIAEKRYKGKTQRKLKRAARVVKCAIRKLPKTKYKCSKKSKPGVVASTLPVVGKTVALYDGFWNSSYAYKVSTLIHEATHKCATSDGNYNYQAGGKPSSSPLFGWQNIASTYDYWIMKGFCVPEDDC